MTGLLLVPALLQMLAMVVDEGWFHRRRGLPKWERIGHPLDTLTVAGAYAWLVLARPGASSSLVVYAGIAFFSCFFITKDEFVHARVCDPGECLLHALLFVLHPIVFLALGVLWWSGTALWIIRVQLLLTLAFAGYQVAYWSASWKPIRSGR